MLNTYKCDKCEKEFESFKENSQCPVCGHKETTKQLRWNGTHFMKGANSASTPRKKSGFKQL